MLKLDFSREFCMKLKLRRTWLKSILKEKSVRSKNDIGSYLNTVKERQNECTRARLKSIVKEVTDRQQKKDRTKMNWKSKREW